MQTVDSASIQELKDVATHSNIPCVLHTIGPWKSDTAASVYNDWIIRNWTIDEVDAVIRTHLPDKIKLIDYMHERSKRVVYPFVLLYVYGGLYISNDAIVRTNMSPLFSFHNSTILFFFSEHTSTLQQNGLAYATSSSVVASCARIQAMLALLDHFITNMSNEKSGVNMAVGPDVVNPFIKQALRSSNSKSVLILPSNYISGEEAFVQVAPTSVIIDDSVTEQLLALQPSKIICDARSQLIEHARAFCAAHNIECTQASDGDGDASMIILDTSYSREKPADAMIDVYKSLDAQLSKLTAGGLMVAPAWCSTVVASLLEKQMHAELIGRNEYSVWRMNTKARNHGKTVSWDDSSH